MIRRIGLLLAASPALALAHTGTDPGHVHGTLDALAAGFTHPLTGADHLAAMVAVGVWSALSSRKLWPAPLAFAVTLWVGALLGLAGITPPWIEPMIAASLVVLGLLVATRAALPPVVGGVIVAGFALFHGAAHGQELVGASTGWAIFGMVMATALLHATGVGLGWALRERSTWLPRAGGALIALFGASLIFA